jgi:ArsR family transcriptional regulator
MTAIKTTDRVDLVFRAYADRTRLRILYLLLGGEMRVADLVAVLRVEQPSASRHLAYLRKVRSVAVRKAGLWKYYSLAAASTSFRHKLLECLACCFQEAPEIQRGKKKGRSFFTHSGSQKELRPLFFSSSWASSPMIATKCPKRNSGHRSGWIPVIAIKRNSGEFRYRACAARQRSGIRQNSA